MESMNELKSKALELFRKTGGAYRVIGKYFFFILEIIFWVIVLCIVIPIFAASFNAVYQGRLTLSNSDFILLITAAFILAYTYETKRLREETVFQRKMADSVDIQFFMRNNYDASQLTKPGGLFADVQAPEAQNNVSEFEFLTAVRFASIGRCGQLYKGSRDDSLSAHYFIESPGAIDAFLKALQLQNGHIKARVLMTNGTEYVYTFKAVGEGWKKTLTGSPNLNDAFILVKKELYEDAI